MWESICRDQRDAALLLERLFEPCDDKEEKSKEETQTEKGKIMKTWRDVYKVHPAADLFPMQPEDELRKLGEDIKANGLAKLAKPVKPRNEKGQLEGQATKDPIKQAAVEEGKKHGIS